MGKPPGDVRQGRPVIADEECVVAGNRPDFRSPGRFERLEDLLACRHSKSEEEGSVRDRADRRQWNGPIWVTSFLECPVPSALGPLPVAAGVGQ
mgnify:CR=1 FL=1